VYREIGGNRVKPFQFMTVHSVDSAMSAVKPKGRYFAGGIDLLGEMKDQITSPELLVNVKELPGLDRIEPGAEQWRIGVNVTVADLIHHDGIREQFSGLAEAAGTIGSPQIRNVATVGGNLAQHSRCWYYRHPDVQCLKNGGATCFAREGENRYHSLFSGNPCISPLVSTLATVFAALDAVAIITRGKNEMRLSMHELYQDAWINPLAHNSLQPGDLILRVDLPTKRHRSSFVEISEKSGFDWALVSCAAAAQVENNVLQLPRVALGSISPRPHQVNDVNLFLNGKNLTTEVADEAAERLLRGATDFGDNGYKIPMAKAAVQRALMKLKT
jgi:xanthine dehydrogenase YagS FAD-binding subunit